ncbi:hypothetical protein KQX54_014309 [Cotesia glomerata]|uniref:Uncharacterized protein n=1 Tax=Cotesia glomerata TaxID=32391 RepID=A0AAV7ISM0_COTGL|nr:hypothetical protein KQX54_014309 [Cotesia glomerata]
MTPELVSALDRNQISNRQAMHIISVVFLSLGLDINDYNQKKKVERLLIAVTGVNTNQLLAAPLVYEATGINEAEVVFEVFEVLNEWNIVDSIGNPV